MGRSESEGQLQRASRPIDLTRSRLRHVLRRLIGLRQIHIIGCSRSGTTMAQFAMVAFDKCIVADGETNAEFPDAASAIRYARMCGWRPAAHWLVTKRTFGWFKPDHVDALVRRVFSEDLYVINVVRDPRDVLCSKHALDVRGGAYVTPEHWSASISAGERIVSLLQSHHRIVTIRYEDFVNRPDLVQAQLGRTFSLTLRSGVRSIGDLEENVRRYPFPLSRESESYMHGLRNLSTSSIERWRLLSYDYKTQLPDHAIRSQVAKFIDEFGYSIE